MIGLIKKDIYLILKNLSAVYLLAILPTVGTLIMKKTGIKLSTIALTPQTIVMLCLGGILVIEFVSFMLSIKIRKKRE